MMMRGRWEARNPENETPRRNSSWANRKDGSTRSGGRMAKKAAKEMARMEGEKWKWRGREKWAKKEAILELTDEMMAEKSTPRKVAGRERRQRA